MFACAGWASLFSMAVLMAPADDPAVAGDLKRMQGKWSTDSFAGTPTTFTFQGGSLRVKAEGVDYHISVTLDEKARPEKTIDMKIEESTTAGAVGKTSPGIYRFDGDDKLLVCFRARGDRPATYESKGFEQWRLELRREAEAPAKPGAGAGAVEPAAADSDAPLPEGWPAPTRPGTIEVKAYPKYRSAILRNEDARASDDERLFFPLFAHISGKGIAMTAPVILTYEPRVLDRAGEKGKVSMEFLYRRPGQGRVGPGIGEVKVEDHPAVTVVSLGVQEDLDEARMREAVARLRAWLDGHEDEWAAAGPPRRLGYHGPQTPKERQLNEVQIPIRLARRPRPEARDGKSS